MLKDILLKSGAIKFGDFVLTSGKRSNYYVDIKETMTDPTALKEVAELISKNLTSDVIAGVELGAVPLVVAVALLSGKRYIIIRKDRPHGTKSLLIGQAPSGSGVNIIEDVVTTGGSVLRAAEILKESGLKVSRVVCVVDREEGGKENLAKAGIELISLLKISEVKS
jgi:orotate phosphoribosyltransferase